MSDSNFKQPVFAGARARQAKHYRPYSLRRRVRRRLSSRPRRAAEGMERRKAPHRRLHLSVQRVWRDALRLPALHPLPPEDFRGLICGVLFQRRAALLARLLACSSGFPAKPAQPTAISELLAGTLLVV